jgi:hypothetical protein
MKNVISGILLMYIVCDLCAVDDKIWGFWMSEPNMSGTKKELMLEYEYHLEKNNGFEGSGYFQADEKEFLDNHVILGTMLYPGNGGLFLITGAEEINGNEYNLFLMSIIGADGGIPVYGEGAIRMVFLEEDTIYFETMSDDKLGTYNHFFRGPDDLKYRAMVTDAYYPERSGIPRYAQIQEERKRLEDQQRAREQEEYNESEIMDEIIAQQPEISLPLIIMFAAAGVLVAAGVAVFLVRRKKWIYGKG